MKLNKLKFKRVKYSYYVSMGGYTHIANDAICVEEGNPSYRQIDGCS